MMRVKKERSPAFSFYVRDRWLADGAVRMMKPLARGLYAELLAHAWLPPRGADGSETPVGHLPNNDTDLADLSGDPIAWQEHRDKVLRAFQTTEDRRYVLIPWLVEEHKKQKARAKQAKENGKNGGRPKTKSVTPGFASGSQDETRAEPAPNPIKSIASASASADSDPAPTEQDGAVGAPSAVEQKAPKPKKPRNAKKAPKPDVEAAAPAPEPALDEELAKVPVDRCLDALASASGGRFVRPSSVSEIVRINFCHWLKGRTMRFVRTMGEWLAAGGWHWKGMLTIADVSTKDVFVSWMDLSATWDAGGRGDPRAMGRPASPSFAPPRFGPAREPTEIERRMVETLAADREHEQKTEIDWDGFFGGQGGAPAPAAPESPQRPVFIPPGGVA